MWHLEVLENDYLEFIGKWEEKLEKKRLSVDDISTVEIEYFALVEKDPHLPYDLLSRGWPAEEAKDFFLSVLKDYTDRER